MQYSPEVLKKSGLIQTDNDAEGQEQYIGTKQVWDKAEKLQEDEDNEPKLGQDYWK
jgi:hypothetical protein